MEASVQQKSRRCSGLFATFYIEKTFNRSTRIEDTGSPNFLHVTSCGDSSPAHHDISRGSFPPPHFNVLSGSHHSTLKVMS